MHAYMFICTSACVSRWRSKVKLRYHSLGAIKTCLFVSFFSFLRQNLPGTQGSPICLGWLAGKPQGSTCFLLPSSRITSVCTTLRFLFSFIYFLCIESLPSLYSARVSARGGLKKTPDPRD